MGVLIISLAWPQIHGIITDKNVWTLGCILFILMFTSGYMFNAIRNTPFTQSNGRGGFNYIVGGFQNQLGVETQIVATICISLLKLLELTGRWYFDFSNHRPPAQGSNHPRSDISIRPDNGMVCGNNVHLLIFDFCLPDEKWRIPVPVIFIVCTNDSI